jgi:hypothetical protein
MPASLGTIDLLALGAVMGGDGEGEREYTLTNPEEPMTDTAGARMPVNWTCTDPGKSSPDLACFPTGTQPDGPNRTQIPRRWLMEKPK